MKWFAKTMRATFEMFELAGRARALVQLRQLDGEFLRSHGYSPEKLARGVAAWPWRVDDEAISAAPVTEIDTQPATPARTPAVTRPATAELTEAA